MFVAVTNGEEEFVLYNVFVAKLREINEAIDLYSAELEGDLRRYGASAETPAQAMGS